MSEDEQPLVLRTDEGHVARLVLDRPRSRNALSSAMLGALAGHLAAIDRDHSVHVVVIAGNGPAFSAGHDLREIDANPDPSFRERLFAQCSDLMVRVTRLRQPVIAEVAGVATAAGCQLVASCDLAVAGASARFATPGVDIGLFCTTPMVAVTRSVAPKHAMELLLTGELVSAGEAARIGLVNRVVPDDDLRATVDRLAATIASKSPLTVAIGKEAFWRQRDLPLVDAYAYASAVMATNLATPDAAEGISAFLAKRPPVWPGR
ncbi:MAG: putative Enoyl-CoA hydratase [Acidimicrobiales bacterium]|nr:putative Enoyl-CoA hydratase [Acidimicrobiales bacterium]